MNKLYLFLLTAVCASMVFHGQAQTQSDGGKAEIDSVVPRFSRKFNYGLTFNNAWTTIKGSNLTETYFTKPSLGGTLVLEYHLFNLVGVGAGFGYQQRGAGIKNPDVYKALGDADSTNRERLRFHSWEVPVYLTWRSPELVSGLRVSGKSGVIWSNNFESEHMFHSVEDGFHQQTWMKSAYYKSDLLYGGSLGLDINAGNAAILQLHFFYHQGTKNVFNDKTIFGNAIGHNQSMGFYIGVIY